MVFGTLYVCYFFFGKRLLNEFMEFEGKILLFKRIGSFKLGFIKWILINEVIFELDRILVFDYF